MPSKAKGVSGGKRGSVMKGMSGNKSTFTAYTGNIVSSSSQSGLKKAVSKKAKPGKVT